MKASRVILSSVALASMAMTSACGSRADEEPAAPAATEAAPAATADTATTAAADVDYASLTGDAAAGETEFAVCSTCHSREEGVNKVGPSLAGIVGRPAGSIEDFNYSDANKNSGITWTEETLFEYLKDPAAKIPGTKMVYPGQPDAQKRADIIAFLKS